MHDRNYTAFYDLSSRFRFTGVHAAHTARTDDVGYPAPSQGHKPLPFNPTQIAGRSQKVCCVSLWGSSSFMLSHSAAKKYKVH